MSTAASSPAPVRQALLLAAGRGSRLRPVTDFTPKPLVPFLGRPLLDWAAAHVVRAGLERVAVNAHHLGDQVVRHVQEVLAPRFPEVDWHVSREEILMGTGGAIAALEGWLDGGSLLVVNADAVFSADLGALCQAHAASGVEATWMLARIPGWESLQLVRADPEGGVTGVGPGADPEGWIFCGAHVAAEGLRRHLPAGPSCVIRQGYLPWMAEGARIQGHTPAGFWADTGTPERFVDATRRGLEAWDELAPLSGLGRAA